MACYHPLRAYRPDSGSACRKLVFSKLDLAHLQPIKVSCGQCIGCRLKRSAEWAMRCVHEASLYERNSFITLTYAPEFLPKSGSLVKADFQKFMKRLRKRYGKGARYYYCGEYGEKNKRPHYHACLFNFDFQDRELWTVRQGVRLYVSDELSKLWGLGFATVGDVTFESAAYVARYITKKVTGERARTHYERVDDVSGECFDLLPEYTDMSRRPGIGRQWFEKYSSDVFPHDRVVLNGADGPRVLRPPKYYDGLFELDDPQTMEEVKWNRELSRKANFEEVTPERLRVREQHQLIRFSKLKRGYENA
ncbi:VP4 [Kummerowia striata gokushovirus]|nr:VP4 [Kummerowia striata gokushovirus]